MACRTTFLLVTAGFLAGYFVPHATPLLSPKQLPAHRRRRLEPSNDALEAEEILAEVNSVVNAPAATAAAGGAAPAAVPDLPATHPFTNQPDWFKFMAYLETKHNPASCVGAHFVAIEDRSLAGIGALLSHFHQTAITLIAQGHAVVFATKLQTNHPHPYANPKLCPAQDWTCFLQPMSKCTHHPGAVITLRDRWPCANYKPETLQELAGLAEPHSRLFYEAAVAAYFMRPNARVRAAELAVREEITLPIARDGNHLSLYIRHGDSANDGRPWIPIRHYAALSQVVEYWEMPGSLGTIFLGSDDRQALADITDHFAHTPGMESMRIAHIPNKYFERLVPDTAARHIRGGIDPDDHAKGVVTPAQARGWDEGTMLLVELRIFASTKAFVGTLNANMNKMAFLLASARHYGDRPQGFLDAAGDTFFGCHDRMRFPKGDWAEYAAKHRDEWLKKECDEKPDKTRGQGMKKECSRLGLATNQAIGCSKHDVGSGKCPLGCRPNKYNRRRRLDSGVRNNTKR